MTLVYLKNQQLDVAYKRVDWGCHHQDLGTQGPPMPFVLVADEAFQISTNVIKPYASVMYRSSNTVWCQCKKGLIC